MFIKLHAKESGMALLVNTDKLDVIAEQENGCMIIDFSTSFEVVDETLDEILALIEGREKTKRAFPKQTVSMPHCIYPTVKKLMVENGISAYAIAKEAGIHATHIYNALNGVISMPPKYKKAIADALGADESIFDEKTEKIK